MEHLSTLNEKKYHKHFETIWLFGWYIHKSTKHTWSSNKNDLKKVDYGLENVVLKYDSSNLDQYWADQSLHGQNAFDRNISIVWRNTYRKAECLLLS